jgi:hypothetical protein
MATRPIAELINDLLAARKTIEGVPRWEEGPYVGKERLLMPLYVEGASGNVDLIITAYPYAGHSRFRVMLCAPKCVWRTDCTIDEPHFNSFDRPADLEEVYFCEPHYHSWSDNRRFCTMQGLPDKLPNARKMPTEVRSFDSCLRWFCGQTNIEQPAAGMITLPPRRRLL